MPKYSSAGEMTEYTLLSSHNTTLFGSDGEESACNAGDPGSIPGLVKYTGEGNGNPLQYSCLENSMDRGTWKTIGHTVSKSQTRLNNLHTYTSSYSEVLCKYFSTNKNPKRNKVVFICYHEVSSKAYYYFRINVEKCVHS